MRRKDREITDLIEQEKILKDSIICRLAFHDDPYPYIVPVNYGYNDKKLYLHCANHGYKVELMEKNPLVTFEIDSKTEVIQIEDGSTMKYQSLIGFGKLVKCQNDEEKELALKYLIEHHGGVHQNHSQRALDSVTMLVLEIEKMTGKANLKK